MKSYELVRGEFGKLFFKYISKRNWVVVNYDYKGRREILHLIKRIKKQIETHLSDNEAMQLYTICRSLSNLKGDLAEVGVFNGGSSKILCQTKGNKSLHLFDTFEGLPKKTKEDFKGFNISDFNCSLEKVKNNLKDYKNVFYYKGLIKDTCYKIKENKFSFVHLDVDLYNSTLDCLEFFYKRMNSGGVILSHDYILGVKHGVVKAFNDFFKDKKEQVIEISDTQCMVVKL